MFQGPMFDVAIGAILLFLVCSLLASAVVETVGGFFHRRSKNLWDTIELLLGKAEVGEGDDVRKLVDQIYREPFVAKLVQPKAQLFYPKANEQGSTSPGLRSFKPDLNVQERKRRFHGPQHIEGRVFAKAFVEAVRPNGNVEADLANFKAEIAKLPAAISKPVGALLAEAGDDFLDARKRIEDWYDAHMQAVSVWYRRQTRYFLFAAGLAIAIVGNVDAVGATTILYRDESVRESVLAQAVIVGQTECDDEEGGNAQVDCLRDELGGAVNLPIGWSDLNGSAGAWAMRILGWLLVAGAVTLGAPFWFDLLRRALAHRKATSSDA
jgi:hypothetical protein